MNKKSLPIEKTAAGQASLHYGWVIVFAGMATIFSCLGLGRFSLGMLLPSMGASLGLSYSQMGIISTGNFVGYMISVVLAGLVAGRIGTRATIAAGLVLTGGSMALISHASGFAGVLVLYVATGIGSGLANVPVMGLVSHWFLRSTRGRAAGIMVSGNGLAIVFAGIYVPYVNTGFPGEGWRTGWFTMGMICLSVAVLAAMLLRNTPADKGLSPIGNPDLSPLPLSDADEPKNNPSDFWTMVHLGVIYSLFGSTYVVYATFIVTTMVNERGFSEGVAGTFWATVGGLSVFSGPLFGWVSDRFGRKTGIMGVFTLFTISYVLVAANLPIPYLYASIVIFGLSAWSIPTIMSAAVGDYVGPAQAVRFFGFITLFFGGGQVAGPAIAGFLADATGSFRIAFWMCAGLTTGAVVLTSFLRQPQGR